MGLPTLKPRRLLVVMLLQLTALLPKQTLSQRSLTRLLREPPSAMLQLRPRLPKLQQLLRVVVVVVEDSTAMKELSVTAMLAAPITEQSQLRTADKIDQLVLKELTMDVDVEDPAAVATWTVTAEP